MIGNSQKRIFTPRMVAIPMRLNNVLTYVVCEEVNNQQAQRSEDNLAHVGHEKIRLVLQLLLMTNDVMKRIGRTARQRFTSHTSFIYSS